MYRRCHIAGVIRSALGGCERYDDNTRTTGTRRIFFAIAHAAAARIGAPLTFVKSG